MILLTYIVKIYLDFNVFFDTNYETQGKESLELCDIRRVRNLKKKQFRTFRQRHNSGFIQRRLDYFLVSNILQESIKKSDILISASTDPSPILFSFSINPKTPRGNGLWKFNNFLCSNID